MPTVRGQKFPYTAKGKAAAAKAKAAGKSGLRQALEKGAKPAPKSAVQSAWDWTPPPPDKAYDAETRVRAKKVQAAGEAAARQQQLAKAKAANRKAAASKAAIEAASEKTLRGRRGKIDRLIEKG